MFRAVAFPFDAFGSAGTAAGALLLADVLREACDDANLEDEPTRIAAYTEHLEIDECRFDTPAAVTAWRETGRELLGDGLGREFTVWHSGNHLGVLPVFDALGPGDLVVQLDAHLDCYNLADSTEELSHGNFLRHLRKPRPKILHVGSRDLFLPPKSTKPFLDRVIPAEDCSADFAGVLKVIRDMSAKAKRVWLDLDTDAIDPAFAPAVQSPQPFGLTAQQLLTIALTLNTPKLAGLSVSEFDPGRDRGDATLTLLAWLVERVLLGRVE